MKGNLRKLKEIKGNWNLKKFKKFKEIGGILTKWTTFTKNDLVYYPLDLTWRKLEEIQLNGMCKKM